MEYDRIKDLRNEKKRMRSGLSGEKWSELSLKIFQKLIVLPLYREAESLFAFMNISNEPDTERLIRHALKEGKKVAIPKSMPSRVMDFYEIASLEETEPGLFSVPEPTGCSADHLMVPDEKSLLIIPGLAFDREGNRLGYGGGYYDTYLKDLPYRNKLMIAFSFQEADKLETKEHDIPVDFVLTEKELIECL